MGITVLSVRGSVVRNGLPHSLHSADILLTTFRKTVNAIAHLCLVRMWAI